MERDQVFLTLQFLERLNMNESLHKLEQESGVFFNLKYFNEMVMAGQWFDIEKYLHGFTKIEDNESSTKIFHELTKQKYLEALYRQDRTGAFDILLRDWKVFSTFDLEFLEEITMLLTFEDFRDHKLLAGYVDTKLARTNLLEALTSLIKENPLLCDKLVFPTASTSRLQSLFKSCWQTDQVMNAEPNSQSETLYPDPMCPSRAHTSNSIFRPVALPVSPDMHCTPVREPSNSSTRWPPSAYGQLQTYANPSLSVIANTTVSSAVLTPSTFSIPPGQGSFPKRPRTLSNYPSSSVEQQPKHLQPIQNCKVHQLTKNVDQASKVAQLLYTNSGDGIVVLAANGSQELWKWKRGKQHPSGKTTASVPQIWHPKSGLRMHNDVSGVKLEEAVPCIALCNATSHVMSAAGGRISLFNLKTFQPSRAFLPPPPASTFLALNPADNNIVAIGMEDSTTHIYNIKSQKVIKIMEGHQKRITGLAFSNNLKILVSSGADGQLCVWNMNAWEKKYSLTLRHQLDTKIQFHHNQTHLLVCQERLLAIHDASNNVECIQLWVPQDGLLLAPMSVAAYSSKSLFVYAAFRDGNIGVFDAETLTAIYYILPSSYIPTSQHPAYSIALATHPEEPSQLAVGLSDGSVKVLDLPELPESDRLDE